MGEYAICTKCFSHESGESLSRFCSNSKCGYMRKIYRDERDEEWKRQRNSVEETPYSEQELRQLGAAFLDENWDNKLILDKLRRGILGE